MHEWGGSQGRSPSLGLRPAWERKKGSVRPGSQSEWDQGQGSLCVRDCSPEHSTKKHQIQPISENQTKRCPNRISLLPGLLDSAKREVWHGNNSSKRDSDFVHPQNHILKCKYLPETALSTSRNVQLSINKTWLLNNPSSLLPVLFTEAKVYQPF